MLTPPLPLRSATGARRRLEQNIAGLAEVWAKVAALSAGWGRGPAAGSGSGEAGGAPGKAVVGLCDLPSDVMGRLLQRLGAVELSNVRAACRKSRAAVDLWEPELWRSLVVQQFIPEQWVSRLLSTGDRAVTVRRHGSQLWSSWKRVYIGLHTKVRRLALMEKQAQVIESKPKDNMHWRRKASAAEDVERKRMAMAKQAASMKRGVSELEHKRVALRQMRKAVEAELSLYTTDGRWDPGDVQIHVEAMAARQQEEERRGMDKLRSREQLSQLQASASQGLQAMLVKLAQVRVDSDTLARAIQRQVPLPRGARSIDAPTDAIGMVEMQLLAMLAAMEMSTAEEQQEPQQQRAEALVDGGGGGRPHSPDSVGSNDSSSESSVSPVGIRRSRLAELEEVQRPDSPPPVVRSASEATEVEINLHLADFPMLGRMRPVQWAIELGAPEMVRVLMRAGAVGEFEDAWHRGREIDRRLKTGNRLLFHWGGGGVMTKLLRMLNGDQPADAAAAGTPGTPVLGEPPAVGRWMGATYDVSSCARAVRAHMLSMQIDSEEDSSEEDDGEGPVAVKQHLGSIRLPVASVRSASDSSSEDENVDDTMDEADDDSSGSPKQAVIPRSPLRGGMLAHQPSSPSINAAATDVQRLVSGWVTQRLGGSIGDADALLAAGIARVAFHMLGSRRLGMQSGTADVCVVISVATPDPLLLPALLSPEADLPGVTLAEFLGRRGVSSVVSVPAADDGSGSQVPQLRMLRQVGEVGHGHGQGLEMTLRFAVVPATQPVAAALQAALVDGGERAALRHPLHRALHSAGEAWRDSTPVTLDALNEAAVASTLLARVPDKALYTQALAAVRFWAKAHGVYGADRGVSGMTWALLCAYVAQRLPLPEDAVDAARITGAARLAKMGKANGGGTGNDGGGGAKASGNGWMPATASASAVLLSKRLQRFMRSFFITWRGWEWPQPVELVPKTRDGSKEYAGLDSQVWRLFGKQGGGLMPVLTPVYPSRSTTLGLKHDSFGRMCAAFSSAAKEMDAGAGAVPSWWEEAVAEAQRVDRPSTEMNH